MIYTVYSWIDGRRRCGGVAMRDSKVEYLLESMKERVLDSMVDITVSTVANLTPWHNNGNLVSDSYILGVPYCASPLSIVL